MGSLGSTTITNSLFDIIPKFKGKDYEVLIITGKDYYEMYPKDLPENVKVIPFLNDLVRLLKNVDVMVTRAGASTIAEILAVGLPSILVPSPYVANNHQYFNAKELVKNNSALLLEEKDFNSENLLKKIDLLLNNSVLYKEMSENAKKLGVIASCDKIYEEIKKVLGG
jgi:UDP-N-acetylglucosamine--N-acetylmuramyl-(pentapeptide) pyrophosphoryl-undecaprenol N-acetylglucosamine transferase